MERKFQEKYLERTDIDAIEDKMAMAKDTKSREAKLQFPVTVYLKQTRMPTYKP